MSEQPIFRVTNHHTDACGAPPAVDDSEPNRYLGYFENEHGEQAIFVYDLATMQRTVHLFQDVASLTELAQVALPVFGQHPATRRDPLGETKALELLEPADQELRLRAMAPLDERLGIDAALGRCVLDLAVERGEALLGDFSLTRPSNLDLEPRPQALGRQLLGGPPKAPGDVGAIHAQWPALAADAADDDVRGRARRGSSAPGRSP
jgi:hypothetical protein